MTILDVQFDSTNGWWVVTWSNGDTSYYTQEGFDPFAGVDGSVDETTLIGMDADTFYTQVGTASELSYNEPPPTTNPTPTVSLFPTYEELTNELETQFPSDGGAMTQLRGRNWLTQWWYTYAEANPDKAIAAFYLTRDVYTDYINYTDGQDPYPLYAWYTLLSFYGSFEDPNLTLEQVIPQEYWATANYNYDPATGQLYTVDGNYIVDQTTGTVTGEVWGGTGTTTSAFGGQTPDPNAGWIPIANSPDGTQTGWIDPNGNYWTVDGQVLEPTGTYYNIVDGTQIGGGTEGPVNFPTGYDPSTWTVQTNPDGSFAGYVDPNGTVWTLDASGQWTSAAGGITGGTSPTTDTIESLQAQLENGEITEQEYLDRLTAWLSANQTAGLSDAELRNLAEQYLAALNSGFAGAAFSALNPEAQLAGQTRDPYRDAAIGFFPELNLPGQRTLMNARAPFESGFLLQGGTQVPEFFTTERGFYEGGGLPLTGQQSLSALQNLYGQYEAFLSDPTGFVQNIANTYGPDQALAFQYSMSRLFDPNNPLGSADLQYGAIMNPLLTNVDPRIAGALSNSFDFLRESYNAARTDPTQSFFIENFVQPGGLGEQLFGAFDEPAGVNFLASAFV